MTDNWPDPGDFPYPAMIRIRYVHELDLELLRVLQHAVIESLDPELAASVAKTITSAAARVAKNAAERPTLISGSASAPHAVAMLLDDCATPWRRRPWPEPPPWWRYELGPQPWRDSRSDPDSRPWRETSLVVGVRVLTAAREALGAVADRAAAKQVEAAVDSALDQLANG